MLEVDTDDTQELLATNAASGSSTTTGAPRFEALSSLSQSHQEKSSTKYKKFQNLLKLMCSDILIILRNMYYAMRQVTVP